MRSAPKQVSLRPLRHLCSVAGGQLESLKLLPLSSGVVSIRHGHRGFSQLANGLVEVAEEFGAKLLGIAAPQSAPPAPKVSACPSELTAQDVTLNVSNDAQIRQWRLISDTVRSSYGAGTIVIKKITSGILEFESNRGLKATFRVL